MKIAILTQPLIQNYGGILQCYALQTILQNMGHEVIVLNRIKSIRLKQLILQKLILQSLQNGFCKAWKKTMSTKLQNRILRKIYQLL